MQLPDTYLTLDPGSIGTGYAFWSQDSLYPTCTGCIAPKQSDNFFQRCSQLFLYYNLLLADTKEPISIYCEQPHYFQSHMGVISARREDFTKLASAYGGLWAISEINGHKWIPVPISEWKGQLPKSAMIQRIKRILPQADYTSHEADAVGIGLYLRKWR